MILRIFQSSQPLVLLLLPIIMLFFWFSGFLHPNLVGIDYTSPLFQLIEPVNPYVNKIVAFCIILITGIHLNYTINKIEFFDKNTYLPALLYVVFMSGVPQFQQLHPIIVSNFFLVLAYKRFLNVHGQVPCKSEIFDASLYILIGAAINYPSGVFLIALSWIVLIIFRPVVLNEYLMPLLALFLVGIYIVAFQYFFNIVLFDWSIIFKYSSESSIDIQMNWTHYVLYSLLFILMILSIYHVSNKINRSTVRYRKLLTTLGMFVLLVFSVIIIEQWYFSNDTVILFAAVPLTLMFTFYFFYAKYRLLSVFIFYVIVGLKLLNIYLIG